MSVQAQAKLVQIGRSDARWYTTAEINATKGASQVGEPIPQDYIQVGDDESRKQLARWKVVAGTGLAEEMGWLRDAQYQVEFPEHYTLRWQNPSGTLDPKKAAVMYGHPMNCTDEYVFRHPYEFIPHLLWLLSDSTDQKHCPCKPCHRATGRPIPPPFTAMMYDLAAKLEHTKAFSDSKSTKKSNSKAGNKKKPPTATAAAAAAAAAISANASGSDSGSKTSLKDAAAPVKPTKKSLTAVLKASTSTTIAAQAPATAQKQAAPAPGPPHPTTNDEPTLFRRGEMVWYQEAPAWRIGVIRKVELIAPTSVYTIVPLCHTVLKYPDVQKDQSQMRPFLTFSVPGIVIPQLQSNRFSQVNWDEVLKNPNYNAQYVGLEASKLAALEIDGSWSTFNRLPAGPKQPKNVSFFGGVFLGAEMIRLGDPLRPRDKHRGTLLEVTEINVTATQVPNLAEGSNPITRHELAFRGIEFQVSLVPENSRVTAQPRGAIFRRDTEFRDKALSLAGTKRRCVWVIKSWDTSWAERDVAGRSYVTGELMDVVLGASFTENFNATGQFGEASSHLNNRGQNANAKPWGRRHNRRVTVGDAVSHAQPLIFGDDVQED